MRIQMTAHGSRFMLAVALALTFLALSSGVLASRSSVPETADGKRWMASGTSQRCCLMAQGTAPGAALMAAAQPAQLKLMVGVSTPRITLMA